MTTTTINNSQILPVESSRRQRGLSMSVAQSDRRGTSMSARNLQIHSLQQQRDQRSKQMANIYGANIGDLDKPVMHKRLNRQHSRKSVRSNRSSHSVKTPMINRKFNDSSSKPQAQSKQMSMLHPVLAERPSDGIKNNIGKKPIDEVYPMEADVFDEEKERQQLEEAQKRKERAKKIREQQEKMLAQIKAQKEAKEKQDQEKKLKFEQKLKAAREQVKANYDQVQL